MPRKKKSIEVIQEIQAETEEETPVSELAGNEETPDTSEIEAKPAQEPEKRAKTPSAKARRKKQVKDEAIEEPETRAVDKRQLILPDAASLFEAGALKESEKTDEPATARFAEIIEPSRSTEIIEQTKLSEIIEQTKAELPAGLSETRREPAAKPTALKFSVSLYERDVAALDQMRGFLRGYGVRKLTDSEAIRIAIRATAPDEKLIEICEQLKLDDNRRK
jgi:hypothetical protein